MLEDFTTGNFFAVVLFIVTIIIMMGNSKGKSRNSSPTFQKIVDKYRTVEEVTDALRAAGLESSDMIIGIDYTASNESMGQKTFHGKPLHTLSKKMLNPYQQVIKIMGQTLEGLDDDNLIPVYGFGDERTQGDGVFALHGKKLCKGFNEVLQRYNEVTPKVKLSGPTNFAPVIRQSIEIVKNSKSYHILVIIADGQVVRRKDTINAIVEASHHPLSIIMVGVGDGPWDAMEEFDDELPQRKFDNFQFVPFHRIMERATYKEASFALAALMEIPDQYRAIQRLGYL